MGNNSQLHQVTSLHAWPVQRNNFNYQESHMLILMKIVQSCVAPLGPFPIGKGMVTSY